MFTSKFVFGNLGIKVNSPDFKESGSSP